MSKFRFKTDIGLQLRGLEVVLHAQQSKAHNSEVKMDAQTANSIVYAHSNRVLSALHDET